MHLLVDADIVVFRCGLAAERNHWHLEIPAQDYVGVFEYKTDAMSELDKRLPGKYSRKEGEDYRIWPELILSPLSHALANVKGMVSRVLTNTQSNEFDLTMYMSGAGNFRNEIAVTRPYKGNRDRVHRPTYEHQIKDYIRGAYTTYVAENEEADDLLGIAQTHWGPEDSCIVSVDKDLDQIPGHKYNIMHDVAYYVDELTAYRNFCKQLLTGDSTDNVPGLPKVGNSKAEKILHGLKTKEGMMEAVVASYQSMAQVDDWYEYLTEQGRLLYIRRTPGEMWTPPKPIEMEIPQGEVSMYD